MAVNGVPTAGEGEHMQRPRFFFDFNLGTIAGLGIPLLLAGAAGYNDLRQDVTILSQKAVNTEQAQTETRVKLGDLADMPIRVKALEEQQKAINARLDRIADAVTIGQERLRQDINSAFGPLQKEIQAVGTKVEVLSDRLANRSIGPQRTSFPGNEKGG